MLLTTQEMRVHKWVPKKLYGFARAEGSNVDVFFHIRAFRWGDFSTKVPPLIGERVLVEYPEPKSQGSAPKARLVKRLEEPAVWYGVVDDFNEQRGFGFILTNDGRSHYLHRSEMVDGTLPRQGMTVLFYEGRRRGRSRACYVSPVKDTKEPNE